MCDDATTLHEAVQELRTAHAAAMAALQALERAMPPPPPRLPPLRFGRLGHGAPLCPYFVHGTASPSPLIFATEALEDSFFSSHRNDLDGCDEDTATPKDLVRAKRERCLHNVDGVYAAVLSLARAPTVAAPRAAG